MSSATARILRFITGLSDLSGLDPEALEKALGSDVFAASVQMFVGRPQPLWWYGKHHSNKKLWQPVIRSLATKPDHPMFGGAFDDVISFEKESELVKIVEQTPIDGLDRTFQALLTMKIAVVGDWHTDVWRVVLYRGEEAGLLEKWYAKIDQALEGILEHPRDVRYWLAETAYANRVFDMISNDMKALRQLMRLENLVETIAEESAGVDAGIGSQLNTLKPMLFMV